MFKSSEKPLRDKRDHDKIKNTQGRVHSVRKLSSSAFVISQKVSASSNSFQQKKWKLFIRSTLTANDQKKKTA